MQTMIVADEGTTMSGDALADLIQRAQHERSSFANLARELPNVSVTVNVGEGPGVVEVAARKGGRGKKR